MKIQLVIKCDGNRHRTFRLEKPISASRDVFFLPHTKTPNAFFMPVIRSKTLELERQFIGDVNRGGSCNVDVLSYVPHGLTHIETSAHVLSTDSKPPFITDIPHEKLCGILYLIDLTYLRSEPGGQIPKEAVETKLKQNKISFSMLALKTAGSLLPQDYDFSGKNFLSLSPEAAQAIHDYEFSISSSAEERKRIDCLLLDLPSIDPEDDEGKLWAHRKYFGLQLIGHSGEDMERRILVELAWFSHLEEGYYYAVITPPRFQTNAVTTGIILHPMIEEMS